MNQLNAIAAHHFIKTAGPLRWLLGTRRSVRPVWRPAPVSRPQPALSRQEWVEELYRPQSAALRREEALFRRSGDLPIDAINGTRKGTVLEGSQAYNDLLRRQVLQDLPSR